MGVEGGRDRIMKLQIRRVQYWFEKDGGHGEGEKYTDLEYV